MKIEFKGGLGDELAMTAVIREVKRQRPDEIIRWTPRRTWILDNNPWVNHGQKMGETYRPVIHQNEKLGSIPHSFAKQIGLEPLADDTPELFLARGELSKANEVTKQWEAPISKLRRNFTFFSKLLME